MRALFTVFRKEFLENLRDRRTLLSALLFGPLHQRPRTHAKRDRPIGFAQSDLTAFQAGAILSGEGFQRSARVDDAGRHRFETLFAGIAQGGLKNFLGGGQIQS